MATTRPRKQRSAVPVLIVLIVAYGCCRSLVAGQSTAPIPLSFELQDCIAVNPGTGELSVGFALRIFGFKKDEAPKVFFGDTLGEVQSISDPDDAGASTVNVSFALNEQRQASVDVRVEQGNHVHIRRSAIRLLPKPRFDGVPCDDPNFQLTAGQTAAFTATALPVTSLEVFLGDGELAVARIGQDQGQIEVPDLDPGKLDFRVSVDVPECKGFSVCGGTVRIIKAEIGIDEEQGKWIAGQSSRRHGRSFTSEMEAKLFKIFEEDHQGAVALGGAEFHLTRIPKGKYSIGLTAEQREEPILVRNNFAGPGSHRGGVLDVPLARPFLIATTEVTNAQFHAYVEAEKLSEDAVPPSLRPHRGGRLPPELSKLPVTGVSFVAARRYVAWLQDQLAAETPSWQVRLPHELEWEMAARGTAPRSYAFVDDDAQRGLESLREPETRPVGTNPLDRSPFGVRDMTGNVREWTNTVYKEQMLLHLAFYIDSGVAEGWDPAHPPSNPELFERLPTGLDKISRGITVRGGANGEPEHLLLLSLRRRLEMTDSEPDVGFRLVWIPREGT